MDLYEKTALKAGEILIESNAEAYRVEETLIHILKHSPAKNVHVVALMTGLYASVENQDGKTDTFIRRIKNRSNNLYKITKVNNISRALNDGLSIEEAYKRLQELEKPPYSDLQNGIATCFLITMFFLLFGGPLKEVHFGLGIGIIVSLLLHIFNKNKTNLFIKNFLTCFALATVTTLLAKSFDFHSDIVISGAVMPMVPGTALTNGVRDIFRGDYTSGSAKLLEAIMIALSIALGIAIGVLLGGVNV